MALHQQSRSALLSHGHARSPTPYGRLCASSRRTLPVATSTTTSQVVVNSSTQVSTAEPPAVAPIRSKTTAPEAYINGRGKPFNWLQYWYPVHVLDQIDPSRPHAVEVLAKQLVLWRDGQGYWQAMDDACPHRLAPLSEGRLEADGTLQCSYHGWRFNSEGRCTEIPQAIDEKAKAAACSSSRSCVAKYPVREEFGLIWVWPTSGPAAEEQAAAAHLPVSKALHEAWAAGRQPTWYRRQLAYSWDILVENLTDPSHLPFSHHNLFPGLKRSSAGAMPFSPVQLATGNSQQEVAERPIWCIPEQAPTAAYSYPASFTAGGTVSFTAPCSVIYDSTVNPIQTELLAVPAGPGRSLVFTAGVFRKEIPRIQPWDVLKALLTDPKQASMVVARAIMQRQPKYKSHLRSNKLFDQDNVFLHKQDVKLASMGKSNWSKDYYMPVSCDGAIIAARRWADVALQQHLSPTDHTDHSAPLAAEALSLTQQTAAAAGKQTKQQVNDRFNQHTKHCMICQQAMKQLERRAAAAKSAAAALGAGLIGWLAGVVVPNLTALNTNTAAAVPPSVAVAVVAVLAVGAAIAAAVSSAAHKELVQFDYIEYNHADNH